VTAVEVVAVHLHRAFPARPWAVPPRPLQFVVVDVLGGDGTRGTGFAWTPGPGASAVAAMVRDDLAPGLLTSTAAGDPAAVWADHATVLAEVGAGGVSALACATLDLALWDLAARRRDRSVAELLGGGATRCDAYFSGINLHYSDVELAEQATAWAAAGATAVKVKVGRPDLADDLRRVRLVRSIVGAGCRVMVDANQRWDLDRAPAAVDALAELEVAWVEEPLPTDDLAGYARLCRSAAVPVAMGENLHTEGGFRRYVDVGIGVAQPSIVRVGGITPFLRIARLAAEAGVALVPHLLPEVGGPLLSALPAPTMVELPDGALLDDLAILAEPSPIQWRDGALTIDPRPGLGLRFVEQGDP